MSSPVMRQKPRLAITPHSQHGQTRIRADRPASIARSVLRVAVAVWAISSPALARAAVTFSETAGGIGGDAFTLNCPAGRVLNGISGRAGDFIDQVRAVCTQLDEIGDVIATTSTARRGGWQADPRNLVTEGSETNNVSAPVLRIVN